MKRRNKFSLLNSRQTMFHKIWTRCVLQNNYFSYFKNWNQLIKNFQFLKTFVFDSRQQIPIDLKTVIDV